MGLKKLKECPKRPVRIPGVPIDAKGQYKYRAWALLLGPTFYAMSIVLS
jgi:hypothetical protein